ncbi:ABC transporter ATP-binding protein [Rheinheimera baltica]|uniref:ABC transporter ATP-binding protein n=1 Tax=Rheinheimera baltica TaxID=67576 RepID=A0ABT9I317_9GAMM|nr:ABC transporter ATP-binding protein [Rheinheimera baltica]MDP5137781.1 ABC transporter ATP-binding protein [Rheinheimera baltica]MDP5142000.1 ABC transporter ATP-binding protein [Rheinheimera baltica]MDP5191213.1 ABC transporter ATP-binding protein [Rheinheimera baltica]
MNDIVIKTQGLTKYFDDYCAVNDLDLAIKRGSIYGFLGPNGCGKSTTMRLLTGLLTPSAGEVKVLGYDLPNQAEALRLKIGYMTQKFSLYDNLSVLENLQFVAQIYGLSRGQRRERLSQLLAMYHLEDKQHVRAGSLSGGQKQRLALAAATLHEPPLLLLDEPTSAVDPENRREFWERLFDLSDSGTTILVSTHYMDEAERCHGLAIMELGKKRADGSPAQLMEQLKATVFQLTGAGLRQVGKQLADLAPVISTAQIGNTLRVLLTPGLPDAKAWLHQQVAHINIEQVKPNLEDVFVASTGVGYAKSIQN